MVYFGYFFKDLHPRLTEGSGARSLQQEEGQQGWRALWARLAPGYLREQPVEAAAAEPGWAERARWDDLSRERQTYIRNRLNLIGCKRYIWITLLNKMFFVILHSFHMLSTLSELLGRDGRETLQTLGTECDPSDYTKRPEEQVLHTIQGLFSMLKHIPCAVSHMDHSCHRMATHPRMSYCCYRSPRTPPI